MIQVAMGIIQEVRQAQVQVKHIRQTIYTIWHGNVYEWTQEANTTNCRNRRGGSSYVTGANYPVSGRYNSNTTDSSGALGTRPTLILNP